VGYYRAAGKTKGVPSTQGRIKAVGTGQLGHGLGPGGFRGPALSKVKEMCRHSYSLSHEKTEKMFWIVTCFMYPRVFTEEGSCGDCCLSCGSTKYFGPRAPQSFKALKPLSPAATERRRRRFRID